MSHYHRRRFFRFLFLSSHFLFSYFSRSNETMDRGFFHIGIFAGLRNVPSFIVILLSLWQSLGIFCLCGKERAWSKSPQIRTWCDAIHFDRTASKFLRTRSRSITSADVIRNKNNYYEHVLFGFFASSSTLYLTLLVSLFNCSAFIVDAVMWRNQRLHITVHTLSKIIHTTSTHLYSESVSWRKIMAKNNNSQKKKAKPNQSARKYS